MKRTRILNKYVNRYKMKDNISLDDILNECKQKGFLCVDGGGWINNKSRYVLWKVLSGNIELEIALPRDPSKYWNDVNYILVMDDNIGHAYYPFYSENESGDVGDILQDAKLANVIINYNMFMSSLSFLERAGLGEEIPTESEKECSMCAELEPDDTLYKRSDWDGGIGFDYIYDIQYCPKCGARLRSYKEKELRRKNGLK